MGRVRLPCAEIYTRAWGVSRSASKHEAGVRSRGLSFINSEGFRLTIDWCGVYCFCYFLRPSFN